MRAYPPLWRHESPLWAVFSSRLRLPLFSAGRTLSGSNRTESAPAGARPATVRPAHPAIAGGQKLRHGTDPTQLIRAVVIPQRFAQQAQPAPSPPTKRTNYAARRPGSPWKTNGSGRANDHAIGRGALADHARSPDIHAMPKGHITGDQTLWKDGNRGIFPTLAAPFAAEGADMADAAPAPTDNAPTRPRPDTFRPVGL